MGSFLVDVKLMSGSTLATLKADGSWTGAQVKKVLKKDYLEADTQVGKLLQDGEIFGDSQKLGRSTNLTAIISRNPELHISSPCNATDFFNAIPYDIVGDEEEVRNSWNLCRSDVMHCGMETAPDIGQQIAKLLLEADPKVDADQEDLGYAKVVVIANPGQDLQKTCCQALGVKPKGVSSDVIEFDWSAEDDDDEDAAAGYLAVLKVVKDNLQNHFRFCAHRESCRQVVDQLVLLGGYASDNSIVGVVHKEAM